MLKKKKHFSRQQYMVCKPLRTPLAELTRIPDGSALLTVPAQGRWPFRMPAGAKKTIQLDAMGLSVWDLCDGNTPLNQIITHFAQQHQIDVPQAETSIVRFLGMLCQRRLVGVLAEEPLDNPNFSPPPACQPIHREAE